MKYAFKIYSRKKRLIYALNFIWLLSNNSASEERKKKNCSKRYHSYKLCAVYVCEWFIANVNFCDCEDINFKLIPTEIFSHLLIGDQNASDFLLLFFFNNV